MIIERYIPVVRMRFIRLIALCLLSLPFATAQGQVELKTKNQVQQYTRYTRYKAALK